MSSVPQCRKWLSRDQPARPSPTTTRSREPVDLPTKSPISVGASRAGLCRSSGAAPAAPRRCTAWCVNVFSRVTSLPGKTSGNPETRRCPRPGRSTTTRWHPGTPRPNNYWVSAASQIRCGPRPPMSAYPPHRRSHPTTSHSSTTSPGADYIPTICRWRVITPTTAPPVRPTSARGRANMTPDATVCCPPLPSTARNC